MEQLSNGMDLEIILDDKNYPIQNDEYTQCEWNKVFHMKTTIVGKRIRQFRAIDHWIKVVEKALYMPFIDTKR